MIPKERSRKQQELSRLEPVASNSLRETNRPESLSRETKASLEYCNAGNTADMCLQFGLQIVNNYEFFKINHQYVAYFWFEEEEKENTDWCFL